MQFEKEVEIRASREKSLALYLGRRSLHRLRPGMQGSKDLEEGKRYAATMVEKVGPFKVEFPTDDRSPRARGMTHIKAQASGADNKIGSRMKLDLDVNLAGRRR